MKEINQNYLEQLEPGASSYPVVLPQVRSSQVKQFFAWPWPDRVSKIAECSDPQPDPQGQLRSGQLGSGQALEGSDPGRPKNFDKFESFIVNTSIMCVKYIDFHFDTPLNTFEMCKIHKFTEKTALLPPKDGETCYRLGLGLGFSAMLG